MHICACGDASISALHFVTCSNNILSEFVDMLMAGSVVLDIPTYICVCAGPMKQGKAHWSV